MNSPTGTQQSAQEKSAQETAQQTAQTAVDQGKQVGQVAAEETKAVAADARDQVRRVTDEARTQVTEQSREQRDRAVELIRGFADELQQMASGSEGGGLAHDLARTVADQAHQLTGRIDGREPSDLLDDVRRFARRRPAVFLLSALAAGVLVGRVTRGARDANEGVHETAPQAVATTPSAVGAVPPPPPVTEPIEPPRSGNGLPLTSDSYPADDPISSGEGHLPTQGPSPTVPRIDPAHRDRP